MGKTQSQYLISWDYNNMVSLQKEENCSYYAHIRNIEKEAQTGDADNSHIWSSLYRGDHRELIRQCSSYWQAWEPRFQTRSNPILIPGIAPKFFILP